MFFFFNAIANYPTLNSFIQIVWLKQTKPHINIVKRRNFDNPWTSVSVFKAVLKKYKVTQSLSRSVNFSFAFLLKWVCANQNSVGKGKKETWQWKFHAWRWWRSCLYFGIWWNMKKKCVWEKMKPYIVVSQPFFFLINFIK